MQWRMFPLSFSLFCISRSAFRARQHPDLVPRPGVKEARRRVTELVMSFSMPTAMVMACEALSAPLLHEIS